MNMFNNSITKELYLTIKELMLEPSLNNFYLGGGTNLAIKYDYRISVDIDLFCSSVEGKDKMKAICSLLNDKYSKLGKFELENSFSENLAFIRGKILKNNIPVKIDIIQNLPLVHRIEAKDNIRFINDLDIGALKLLSVSQRGSRKDFYDLYILAQKYGLEKIYDELMFREQKFNGAEYENIFNKEISKPNISLSKTLTPLCNFNNANLVQNNIVEVTNANLKNVPWFQIKEYWKKGENI